MRNWAKELGLINLRKVANTDTEIRLGLKDGVLLRLTSEIAIVSEQYRELKPWDKASARAAAVAMTLDRAVVTGRAALRLWEIGVWGIEEQVDAVYPEDRRAPGRGHWPAGVRYQTGYLPLSSLCVEEGLRVVCVARAVIDVARLEGLKQGVIAVDSFLRVRSEVTKESLYAELDRGGKLKNKAIAARAIELGRSDSGSVLESSARFILVTEIVVGLESLECQVEFRYGAEEYESYVVDFLINKWIILEVDGASKYLGAYGLTPDEAIRRERQREKYLQNLGKAVIRCSKVDLVRGDDGEYPLVRLVERAIRNFVRPDDAAPRSA